MKKALTSAAERMSGNEDNEGNTLSFSNHFITVEKRIQGGFKMSVFETLNGLNVNGHIEKKKVDGKTEITYLSWPWAWAEVKKRYPDAHYEIKRGKNGLPYSCDPITGYMVFTSVTIEGITHDMWLPVMDGANNAMKQSAYVYSVKNPNFKYAKRGDDGRYYDKYGNEQPEYFEKHVKAATMFDVNKAIMRCLVKNLAMFGLGLYIYAGEDLPEGEEPEKQEEPVPDKMQPTDEEQDRKAARLATIGVLLGEYGIDKKTFNGLYEDYCKKVLKSQNTILISKLTDDQFDDMVFAINEKLKKGVA